MPSIAVVCFCWFSSMLGVPDPTKSSKFVKELRTGLQDPLMDRNHQKSKGLSLAEVTAICRESQRFTHLWAPHLRLSLPSLWHVLKRGGASKGPCVCECCGFMAILRVTKKWWFRRISFAIDVRKTCKTSPRVCLEVFFDNSSNNSRACFTSFWQVIFFAIFEYHVIYV